MDALTTSQIWTRFLAAAAVTTVVCVPASYILLRTTGVPETFPPLRPPQVVAGAVGGALLVTIGYWLLTAVVRDRALAERWFVGMGVFLLAASFYLPYRLTFTTSPRFVGVTLAALVGQGLLHALVVGLSMLCFLSRSPWRSLAS